MHKFTSTTDTLGGKGSGQAFAFLSSGQREEVQKILYRIKSTGRKVEDPSSQVVLEEAENQDQIMASLFSLDDQIHQAFEHELKKELIGFVKNTSPLFSKMKGQLIEQLMGTVRKSFKCFPEDTVKRLQTNLAFGGKDLPEDEFERVLVSTAGAELGAKANQAFHQTVTIASDYMYEKMQDLLQDICDDLTNEVQNSTLTEERKKDPESKGQPSKAPTKAQPVPPKAAVKGTKAAVPTKSTTVKVESLPKVEASLDHVVKDRPAQQGKRPPTRKKRPAPPTQQTAM